MSPSALLVGQCVTQDAPMPEFQPVSSAAIAAIERPRCPKCNQNRMLLSKLKEGQYRFDHPTFEGQKCRRLQKTVGSIDHLQSASSGLPISERRPPTPRPIGVAQS